jgi:hypothetical protein
LDSDEARKTATGHSCGTLAVSIRKNKTMRKLLTVILIFISILVNGQEKIHITEIDSCKCKTIIKSFKYFEKKVYKKMKTIFIRKNL